MSLSSVLLYYNSHYYIHCYYYYLVIIFTVTVISLQLRIYHFFLRRVQSACVLSWWASWATPVPSWRGRILFIVAAVMCDSCLARAAPRWSSWPTSLKLRLTEASLRAARRRWLKNQRFSAGIEPRLNNSPLPHADLSAIALLPVPVLKSYLVHITHHKCLPLVVSLLVLCPFLLLRKVWVS